MLLQVFVDVQNIENSSRIHVQHGKVYPRLWLPACFEAALLPTVKKRNAKNSSGSGPLYKIFKQEFKLFKQSVK
jgi:hypothetical protein